MIKTFKELAEAKFGSVYACAKYFDEHELGISGVYIYKLAAGEYSNVSIKMLPILAIELEIDILDLLEIFGINTEVV